MSNLKKLKYGDIKEACDRAGKACGKKDGFSRTVYESSLDKPREEWTKAMIAIHKELADILRERQEALASIEKHGM